MIIKVKRVKQLPNYCGPACVLMILQLFGVEENQKKLGVICNITETGVAPTAIVRCFKKYGIHSSYKHSQGIRKSIEDYLEEYKYPIIIGTEEHYMMIIGYDFKNFILVDPADGKQSVMNKKVVLSLIKDMIIIKGKIGEKK